MLDLTFGPSFEVKQWFTGFGELSFWWIQICIGSLMRRSGVIYEVLIIVIRADPFRFSLFCFVFCAKVIF